MFLKPLKEALIKSNIKKKQFFYNYCLKTQYMEIFLTKKILIALFIFPF